MNVHMSDGGALHCMCAAVQGQCQVKGKSTAAEWMDLTEVQWLQHGRAAQHSMLICQLVHQSVEVWWPEDKSYYRGTVTAYITERVGAYTIQSTVHTPCEVCWRCLCVSKVTLST